MRWIAAKPRFSLLVLAVLTLSLCAVPMAQASADGQESLLAALSAESDTDLRIDILIDLGAYEDDAVRVALEAVAGDVTAPPSVRMQAVCSLSGSATSASVPLLLSIIETDLAERHGYWACGIPLLGSLGDRRAVPLLKRIGDLGEEHLIGMDHMAIAALAEMAVPEDAGYLLSKAHVWPVRTTVIATLARLAAPEAVDLFIAALADAEVPEAKGAAQGGLVAIGLPAVPALEDALALGADDAVATRIRAILDEINRAAVN